MRELLVNAAGIHIRTANADPERMVDQTAPDPRDTHAGPGDTAGRNPHERGRNGEPGTRLERVVDLVRDLIPKAIVQTGP
jgi:hypothetical protein